MKKYKFIITLLFFTSLTFGQIFKEKNYRHPIFNPQECTEREGGGNVTTYVNEVLVQNFEITEWELVFSDEFNGSELNTSEWNTIFDWGPHVNLEEEAYFKDDHVEVSDGTLKLTLDHDPEIRDAWDFNQDGNLVIVPQNFTYTGGMIASKRTFKAGKFEMRCKFPTNRFGQNPAFWLYGDCSQEIDVFEFLDNDKDRIAMTIHGSPDWECETDKCFDQAEVIFDDNVLDNDNWHIFSVEWTYHSVIWKVDGVVHRLFPRFYSGSVGLSEVTYPGIYIHDPLFPLLSNKMQILVTMANDHNVSPTSSAASSIGGTMEIDWIRVYKNKYCDGYVSMCNEFLKDDYNFLDEYRLLDNYSFSEGDECNFHVTTDENIFLKYASVADFYPGTQIDNGANFELLPMICTWNKTNNNEINKKTNLAETDRISIAPNPILSKLRGVIFSNQKIVKCSMYDLRGNSYDCKLVAKESSDEESYEYRMEHKQLVPGVYVLKLELSNFKISIQKMQII